QGVSPVICCGMVGARQGWAEAAYMQVPCSAPDAKKALRVKSKDPRVDVRILPGLCQNTPADVMRGEETQIAGYLAKDPNFFGTLCLPGTHSKWTQISAEEIVSFRTFMTGELFALLSTQSVLRHALDTSEWSEDDYLEALNDAMSAPQQLSARLFALRADGLLHGLSPTAVRSRLSGYLIGLELAGAKPYWLGLDVVVIGDPKLTPLYTRALKAQGVSCLSQNGDEMTQAGLKAAYRVLKEG
ncbi:MAG: 2-dehydro-3-deoxygalactonokinase, partial [Paracoccaceae bacterium]